MSRNGQSIKKQMPIKNLEGNNWNRRSLVQQRQRKQNTTNTLTVLLIIQVHTLITCIITFTKLVGI